MESTCHAEVTTRKASPPDPPRRRPVFASFNRVRRAPFDLSSHILADSASLDEQDATKHNQEREPGQRPWLEPIEDRSMVNHDDSTKEDSKEDDYCEEITRAFSE